VCGAVGDVQDFHCGWVRVEGLDRDKRRCVRWCGLKGTDVLLGKHRSKTTHMCIEERRSYTLQSKCVLGDAEQLLCSG